MSNFEVKIEPIFVRPHPNADRLELGNIGTRDGWQVVIGSGRFKTGDLVAYIPENALVPDWVLQKYGYWDDTKNKGMLAGSGGNRVKACKLRDEFSLGICIPVQEISLGWREEEKCLDIAYTLEGEYVVEDEDVAELLGITKYETPIPTQMAGEVYNAGTSITLNYDIENIKNYPDVIVPGELVQVTGKLHGTFCQIVYIPIVSPYVNDNHLTIQVDGIQGQFAIASKGLGSNGLCFKWNDVNSGNLYQRTVRKYFEQIMRGLSNSQMLNEVFVIAGEVFGNNVQDLNYGYKTNVQDFRVFDMYQGVRGQGHYLDDMTLDFYCEAMDLKRVEVLYKGPFDLEVITPLCQGAMETSFDPNQIREGVVISSLIERKTSIGRARVKMINEKYLLRRGRNISELS